MRKLFLVSIVFAAVIIIGLSINATAEESLIPAWIKNTARFWVDDQISDKEFLSALQYLVDKNILQIPAKEQSISQVTVASLGELLPTQPEIKNKFPYTQLRTLNLVVSGDTARQYYTTEKSEANVVITKYGSEQKAREHFEESVSTIKEDIVKRLELSAINAEACFGGDQLITQSAKIVGRIVCYKGSIYYSVSYANSLDPIESHFGIILVTIISDKIR